MATAELRMENNRDIYHVAIVDDDPGVRFFLSRLFESAGIHIRSYESAEELLADTEIVRCGCVVLDINLAGISGLELQSELRRRGSNVPIVIISGQAAVSDAIRAFSEGASAFFEKPFKNEDLLATVQQLMTEWAEKQEKRQAALAKLMLLSPREKEVLEGLVAGKTTIQIAHQLGISPSTVEKHRLRIYDKTGENSIVGLVRLTSI